ncbi:hypothetical protein V1264_004482 [Littorina saxatilis]
MRHMAASSLLELVEEQVERTPDVVAVIYDEGEERCCVRITYQEMWQRACQISMELQKNTVENETVGVCAEPGINLPSTLLGIMKASSAYFPFGQDGAGFVKQSLAKLGVKHLLLDVSSFQRIRPMLLKFQTTVLQSTELQYLGFYLVRLQPLTGGEEHVQHVSGLAYCITTSGTTGTPKIVRVPHSCIAPNVSDFR